MNVNKYLFILLFLPISVIGQEFLQITKTELKTTDEDFKTVWSNLQKANDLFVQDTKGTYKKALEYYLSVFDYNPNNAKLNYLIGVCYLNTISKNKSYNYFLRAYKANKNIAKDLYYWLGVPSQLNYKFDEAIGFFESYKKKISPSELKNQLSTINKRIQECNSGKKLTKHPVRVFIDNMGENINTEYPEYSPVISADEEVLYFTSRRDDTYGAKKDPMDFEFYEDIYVSLKAQGEWLKAYPLSKPINTKGHDATVGLAPDGQSLFIFRNNHGGNIYESVLDGDDWTSPAPLPKVINSKKGFESSACLASDGATVYFVRANYNNNTGELLDKSIYVSTKNPITKLWSQGVKLPAEINTEYDEDGVFIHPDGRTLFFSSKGHNSMGGYDIFKSVKNEDGKWSKAENLGYPINTPDDDIFFVLSASGRNGYFSSYRPSGKGDLDIYKITFLSPENLIQSTEDNLIASIAKPVSAISIAKSAEIKKIRLTIVKGLITEALTGEAIDADIEVIDNEKNQIVTTAHSNKSSGKYLVALPSGKNYGLVVKAEGYLFHSENFNIPKTTEYQVIEKDINMLSMSIGSKVVLKNIFFETGSSKLKSESKPELDRVIKLLEVYPNLKIEISGHTDNIGTNTVNKELSRQRAKAVVDYLSNNGIELNRLTFVGYGSSKPIASNKTKEGRRKNRRVEFKILEN